jgi:hypothetical protein
MITPPPPPRITRADDSLTLPAGTLRVALTLLAAELTLALVVIVVLLLAGIARPETPTYVAVGALLPLSLASLGLAARERRGAGR